MADGVNLGSAFGSIEISTESAAASVNSLSKTLQSAGKAMSLGVTAPLAGIATMAIDSAADFEQSLNVMQQVSGATADQMATLQAQALNLGAVTSFSAGEAAEAMLELAKAGLSPVEVGDAIAGTMDLAAAGNLDLAQAAEIAANAVNTFGLEASDSTRIANMLAAAANASSVDVTDLAAGMQMAGAVFSSAGQSIDDLNIAMALLGNNGIKGSDAGTSLKTALMRLTAPTDEAAAALASLGVNVFDAQGNMREFPAILADLQQGLMGTNAVTVTSSNLTAEQAERMEYLKDTIDKTQRKLADYATGIAGVAQSEADKVVAQDRLNRVLTAAQAEYASLASIGGTTSTVMKTLTEEERQQALATIFGADAIRSISVLMAEGTDGWNEMADSLGVAGAATATANARMKGMRGAIEYLKGSIDSFLIGAALPYLDALGNFVRMGADALSAFAALPRPIMDAAVAIGAVLAAAGPLMLAISRITAAIGFLLSPVGLLVAGVAALAAGFVLWQQNFMGIQQRAAQFAVTLKDMAESATGIDFDAVADGLRSFGGYLRAVAEDGDYLNDWLTHLPEPIQPAVQALGQLVAAFGVLVQDGDFDAFVQSIQSIDWGGLLGQAVEGLNGLKDGMVAALQEIDWAGALATAAGWLDNLKSGVVAAIQGIPWGAALTAAGNVFGMLAGWVTAALREIPWATALETAAGWLDALKGGVVSAVQSIDWGGALTAAGDWLANLWGGVVAALKGIPWATALTGAAGWLDGLTQGIVNRIKTINWGALLLEAGDFLANLWGNVVGALGRIDWAGALATAGTWLTNLTTQVVTAITGIDWAGALTAAGSAFGGLETAVSGALSALGFAGAAAALDNIKAALEGIPAAINGAKAAFSGLLEQVTPIANQLKDFFAPAMERLQTAFLALPENLAPLLPKLQELGGAIGGLMQALAPFALLVGAGLAIAVNFGINTLTATFETLPGILGPIIDQVTATIKLITTIINEVIAGVKAAIDGDWAAVWQSAQSIAGAFVTFFRGLFSRLGTFMGAVAKRISDPIINTLKDLGVDITPILQGIQKTFEDIWGKIQSAIQLVIDIVGTVTDKISEFKSFLQGLSLPNPFQPLVDAWNTVKEGLGLIPGTGTAGGTSYFGGGVTAINERGYEQVVLPAGSRVYTAGQTNNLEPAGERVINLNLGGVTVNSPMDARRLGSLLRDQLIMEGI